MERILTQGVIYKLIKYTDNSAIALAYTKDFGKIKLFIPKAFSGKSGILTLIPGEVDFLKKDNSDLNKLYSFRPNLAYMSFIDDPALSLRLTLIYDFFDNLYDVDQPEPILWTMITRLKKENATSALIFILYAILKNTGQMFVCGRCSSCGKEITGGGALFLGDYYCDVCKPEKSISISSDEDLILRSLSKPNLYKRVKISIYQELGIIDIFIKHTETAIGKKIKSFQK